jgi:glycyl-radical enzyme activating protein
MVSGVVFVIQRYSLHDGPGLRTLVFLKGCALRCLWCSNPESQSRELEMLYDVDRCTRCGACVRACPNGALSLEADGSLRYEPSRCTRCGRCVAACVPGARRIAGAVMTSEEVVAAVMRDAPFYRRSGGGVTLGGGEPTLQSELAAAVLRGARSRGVDTAIETCGHAEQSVFLAVALEADHVLFDVKHADSPRHATLTGAGNESILANLRALLERDCDVTVRYPFVPGLNSGENDVAALAAMLHTLTVAPPVELVPYHRLGEHKYRLLGRDYALSGTLPPETADMDRACSLLRQHGIRCRALSQ